MNTETVKNMDPFQANLLLLLERIAKALETLVVDEHAR